MFHYWQVQIVFWFAAYAASLYHIYFIDVLPLTFNFRPFPHITEYKEDISY